MNRVLTIAICTAGTVALMGCQSAVNNAVTQSAMVAMAAPPTAGGANKPLLEALQEENRSRTRTAMADLPPSGSATYTGFAQVISDRSVIPTTGTELVGKARLEVGFAGTGSMTGTIDDFDDNGTDYGGSLTVSGGEISAGPNGPQVQSAVSGTLTNGGASYDVDGNITGGFLGPDGEYLNGFDDITVTSGGKTSNTNISLNAARE